MGLVEGRFLPRTRTSALLKQPGIICAESRTKGRNIQRRALESPSRSWRTIPEDNLMTESWKVQMQDNLHKAFCLIQASEEAGVSAGKEAAAERRLKTGKWVAHSAADDRSMDMLRRSSVFAAEVFDRSPTDKELVSQGKALCRDYIYSRLNRAGIGWSKPEHGLAASGGTLGEISSVLLWLGDELEYLRPNVYRNVARQLNITVASENVVSDAFLAVAADIFSTGVTWGKVVSLYAVAGALAVDCVRHGHPAMVHTIVDCMGEFVRKSLTPWLKRRGGWVDVTKCVVNTDPSFHSHWLVSAVCAFGHYLKTVVLYLLREK